MNMPTLPETGMRGKKKWSVDLKESIEYTKYLKKLMGKKIFKFYVKVIIYL